MGVACASLSANSGSFKKGQTPHNRIEVPGLNEALGSACDEEVAKRFGLPVSTVKGKRVAAGIPVVPKQRVEVHPRSALDRAQVLEIRANKDNLKRKQLACKYGVSIHVINDLLSGRTWKHI